MSPEEATKVAEIACCADGGCIVCTENLITYLENEFPEHKEIFRSVWNKEFNRK